MTMDSIYLLYLDLMKRCLTDLMYHPQFVNRSGLRSGGAFPYGHTQC